jgi:hypothetical protein
MQLCDFEWFFGRIDSGYPGASRSHAFCEYAAATSDIQHSLSGQRNGAVDVIEAQWIDFVQRLELAPKCTSDGRC